MVDVFGIKKFVKVLAANSRLTVQFINDLPCPNTDGGTIRLENPKSTWTQAEYVEWWGALYHEISHNYPETRDCFELQKSKDIDMSSFLGIGINIMIDHQIELFKNGEYLGRDKSLEDSMVILTDSIVAAGTIGKSDEEDRQAIESLMCFDLMCREVWQHGLIGVGDDIYKQLNDKQKRWVDKLMSNVDRYQAKAPPFDTAYTIYDKWLMIIDEVFEMDAKEKEKEGTGDGGEGGSGTETEGEGSSGTNEGDDGEGEDGESKMREKAAKIKYSDLLKHSHDEESGGASYTPLKIEYDVSDRDHKFAADTVRITDYTKGTHEAGSNDFYAQSHADGLTEIKGLGKGLSGTIRRLLQIRSKSKRQHGKKRGKINGKALYRMSIPNSGSYGEKVFSQKIDSNMLDTSVTVLGDMSGSMGGDKYVYMAHSCIMLNEAISPLRIPLEILGFTENGNKSDMFIYKTFNGKTNAEWLSNDFVRGSERMGNNADGEAIQFAFHRLSAQTTKRKILIVLSDGQPASARRGAHAHTEDVIKYIEESSDVEIYGIGIQDDEVTRLYKEHSVIKRPQELEAALLAVIQSKIITML